MENSMKSLGDPREGSTITPSAIREELSFATDNKIVMDGWRVMLYNVYC
jgi:hypothetical protein